MPSHSPVRGGFKERGATDFEGWKGASGTLYPYTIVEVGQHPNVSYGNYIFAKRARSGKWVAIFAGHGDLELRTDLDLHTMRKYIRRRGATHVHIHENPSLPDRMIEKEDILEVHPEAGNSPGHKATVPA